MKSETGRGTHHRQQLRLHRRLRERETQPPAGVGLRDDDGGGSAPGYRVAQLHVDEHVMR
eukprot:5286949-Pyramimonas_sp.AAC.1